MLTCASNSCIYGRQSNHFHNSQTEDNKTIETLNNNVVQDNPTDSQESPIKNNIVKKRIWLERNRKIDSNRHRRETKWI